MDAGDLSTITGRPLGDACRYRYIYHPQMMTGAKYVVLQCELARQTQPSTQGSSESVVSIPGRPPRPPYDAPALAPFHTQNETRTRRRSSRGVGWGAESKGNSRARGAGGIGDGSGILIFEVYLDPSGPDLPRRCPRRVPHMCAHLHQEGLRSERDRDAVPGWRSGIYGI